MPSYTNQIRTPKFYQLNATCQSHGWKYLAPFVWDGDRQGLQFAWLADDEPVDIHVTQSRRDIALEVLSHRRLNSVQKDMINQAIIRALGLATPTEELYALAQSIHSRYGERVKNGAGRLLRAPTLWEDVAKTLFTTNCSWNLTRIMSSAACSSRFSIVTPSGGYPFPLHGRIARSRETTLKEYMRVGYRAPYIKHIARSLQANSLSTNVDTLPETELRQYLSSLTGFGPYAVNHMMVLCGYYDQIPVDSLVRSYLRQQHGASITGDYADFIQSRYARWGRYAWWGMRLERMANPSE